MLVNLRITKPLPAGGEAMTIAIDPLVTSCKFSDSLPGGYNGLTVGMPDENTQVRYYLSQPADIPRFGHVEASIGSARVFEGKIMQRHIPHGAVRGFAAVGYGLIATREDYYRATSLAQSTSGVILREALTYAPLLSVSSKPGDWVDPGVYHTRAEFDSKSPYEIINQFSSEGGGASGTGGTASAGWDWQVWENRIASFKPRTPPTTAHYSIDLSSVVLDEDLTNMYGTVAVTYGSTKTRTDEKTDPTFLSKYGFRRAISIPSSNLNAAQAKQFRDTEAAIRALPAYAVKITLKQGQDLATVGGEPKPAYLVRAGEWIQAGDLPMLVVLHKEHDAMTQATTLTVGAYPPNWYTAMREAMRVAAAYKRLTNPNSGSGL